MRPTLNVLGCGRLGSTLARLLTATGSVAPGGFFSRSQASAADARAFVGAGTVTATLTQLPDADLWLLAVPDGAIGEVAKQLAGLDRDWHGITVFHCSGLHDSSLLAPLAARGALTASLHPAHSFGDRQKSLESFAGPLCAIEGDSEATALLTRVCAPAGARTIAIPAAAKPLYHAATAAASNYLVTLVAASLALLEQAGISDANGRALLGPLMSQTAANVLARGPEAALTGPIARGDADTVAQHLGQLTADIVAPERSPEDDALAQIRALLAHQDH